MKLELTEIGRIVQQELHEWVEMADNIQVRKAPVISFDIFIDHKEDSDNYMRTELVIIVAYEGTQGKLKKWTDEIEEGSLLTEIKELALHIAPKFKE